MLKNFHAIIPAGGAGTRLWPLSRKKQPKFLLNLLDAEKSLLQQTVERILPVAQTVTVVTGISHATSVAEQLRDYPRVQVLIEPSAKDSLAAIGYASEVLRLQHGEQVVVGSFAADHAISDVSLFQSCVERAVAAADSRIVTLGVTPDAPATAYGYIKPRQLGGVSEVACFVEKPEAELAAEFVRAGYLWNAGIFIMRAALLKRVLEVHHPVLARDLTELAELALNSVGDVAGLVRLAAENVFESRWQGLMKIAFDYAVAEPAAANNLVSVLPLPAAVGWSDVGDYAALAGLYGDKLRVRDFISEGGSLRLRDISEGGNTQFFSGSGQRLLVTVGASDLLVSVTEDVILIANSSQSQELKQVVEWLENSEDSEFI